MASSSGRSRWRIIRCLLQSLRTLKLAVSLGGVVSLVEHPASMSHGPMCMSDEDREAAQIDPALIRLRYSSQLTCWLRPLADLGGHPPKRTTNFFVLRKTNFRTNWPTPQVRGGATVLKVGGQILRAKRAEIFLTPTFWPMGGQNIA